MKTLLTLSIAAILVSSCGPRRPGKIGAPGLDGKDGKDGIDAVQCTVQTISTGARITCGDSVTLVTNGTDATSSVYAVKFCPGLVDSYGQQYSEQGICIANKVYAVYSSNNKAALVELSSGNYTTTTPQGANCTFTVSNDCEIN